MRFILSTIFATLLWLTAVCRDQIPLNKHSLTDLTPADVQYHVNYLASDQLEGRQSGLPGAEAAAKYIAAEFKRFGLKPLGDGVSFFQRFNFTGGVELGQNNSLSMQRGRADTSYHVGVDFMPAGFSQSANLEASESVAFVGYGITAKTLNYDEYEGVDCNGRVVLALRYAPTHHDPHGDFADYAPLRFKALQAREHGAAALLIVSDSTGNNAALPRLSFDRAAGDAGLPVVFITRAVAEWLLHGSGETLQALQDSIDFRRRPRSFIVADTRVKLQTQVNKVRREAENVIGILTGSDPNLRTEAVVVGAHYDHLGRSSEGAMDPERENEIRNGADDNASGTAGLLELAQHFAAQKSPPRRSLVFMGFSGEELGLLGSAHYVAHPTFPLEKTVAMINMDMIGRLQDSALVVQGIGTSPRFPGLVKSLDSAKPFKLSLKKDGLGPSDQASFYQKNVPVLFFFTGLHSDYHRASDDADKINAAGETEILKFVANILTEIANSDSVPLFTKTDSEQPREARAFRVSVGTVPDYAAEVEGLKLSGVRPGGPAEKAGLQAGDIIVKFGHIEVKNIYDYTYALGEFTPGQEIDVIVLRDGERKTLRVKLEPSRRM
ncbi:MAG: M28 family peptidase [bacterium]